MPDRSICAAVLSSPEDIIVTLLWRSFCKPPVTVDSIVKAMGDISKNLEAREIIPPEGIRDLQVSLQKDKYYKVTYTDTLSSVHFITGKHQLKTTFVKADHEVDAKYQANYKLGPNVEIKKVEFDHEEEDRTMVNIQYYRH